MRPAVQLIARGQRKTEREEREISEGPDRRPGYNGAEPPDDRHEPQESRATVAEEFNCAVPRHCQRISVMFAKRTNQLAPDDGRRLFQEGIEKPVQESGHEIGANDPDDHCENGDDRAKRRSAGKPVCERDPQYDPHGDARCLENDDTYGPLHRSSEGLAQAGKIRTDASAYVAWMVRVR